MSVSDDKKKEEAVSTTSAAIVASSTSSTSSDDKKKLEEMSFFSKLRFTDVTIWGATSLAAYTVLNAMKENQSFFAWHPRAAILGYCTAITGAHIMASRKRGLYKCSRFDVSALNLHQAMMAASTALTSFAFYRIWANKDKFNKPHIQTTHAYLGASAVGLLYALNLFTIKISYLSSSSTPFEWKLHRNLAKLCLTLWGGAVATGAITTFNTKEGAYTSTTFKVIGAVTSILTSFGLSFFLGV